MEARAEVAEVEAGPIMISKRHIDTIFLHCSASDNPEYDNVAVIRRWHLARGWSDCGYHYYIPKNGILRHKAD